ncbi:MAG: hypothetical protein IJD77_04510 [Clostridia bacterium]|nr:hypothetical protein [Clostridia bacterium]
MTQEEFEAKKTRNS